MEDHNSDDGYALISEDGYTSGFITGDEDDDDEADLFDASLDPMALLRQMEEGADDTTGPQPYQILRTRRLASRQTYSAGYYQAAGGGDEGEEEEEDEDEELEEMQEESEDIDEADLSSGRGRGRGRGKGRGRGRPPLGSTSRGRVKSRGSSQQEKRGEGAGSAFGADADEIYSGDPLAMRLGLVSGHGNGLRGRGGRRKGGRWGPNAGTAGSARRARRRQMLKKEKETKEGKQVPDEVARMLGEANLCYATGDLTRAMAILTDVIKAFPNFSDPFHTLGLVHEAAGNPRKALDFFMIAAHMSPKDATQWKRLAALSTDLGFFKQAIYCLTRVLRQDKKDVDAKWDRAVLYAEIQETRQAVKEFELLAVIRTGDPEVPKMLARLHHRIGASHKAIEVLEAHMRNFPASTDFTHVNILSELYMSQGLFDKTYSLIARAERELLVTSGQGLPTQGLSTQGLPTPISLPLDLTVKAGLCLSHLNRHSEAGAYFSLLLQERPEEGFGDLFLEVASTLLALGRPAEALIFYEPLLTITSSDPSQPTSSEPSFKPLSSYACDPGNWSKAIQCFRHQGRTREGLKLFETLVSQVEVNEAITRSFEGNDQGGGANVETEEMEKMMGSLADALIEAGQLREAERWVAKLRGRLGWGEGEGDGGLLRPAPSSLLPSSQKDVSRLVRVAKLQLRLSSCQERDGDPFAEDLALMFRACLDPALDPGSSHGGGGKDGFSALGYESGGERGGRETIQVPVDVAKAIKRRQMMAKKGTIINRGIEDPSQQQNGTPGPMECPDASTSTAFKALVSSRKDRRTSKIVEADRKAEELLASLGEGLAIDSLGTQELLQVIPPSLSQPRRRRKVSKGKTKEGDGDGEGEGEGEEASEDQDLDSSVVKMQSLSLHPALALTLGEGGRGRGGQTVLARSVLANKGESFDLLLDVCFKLLAEHKIRDGTRSTRDEAGTNGTHVDNNNGKEADVGPSSHSPSQLLRHLLRHAERVLELQSSQPLLGGPSKVASSSSALFPFRVKDKLAMLKCDMAALELGRVMEEGSAVDEVAAALTPILKGLCPRWPDSLGLWSRFCRLSPRAGQARSWSSFIPHLNKTYPSSLPLAIMQGHVHLMARQHDQALEEYLRALTFLNPNLNPGRGWEEGGEEGQLLLNGCEVGNKEVGNKEPLLMLLIGVTLLNIASTRASKAQTMGRNRAVLSAFAFLDGYATERMRRAAAAAASAALTKKEGGGGAKSSVEVSQGCQLEVSYNLGRGAHQMGQVHLARSHYLDVLEGQGRSEGEGQGQGQGQMPFQLEAAHNLAIIYAANGAHEAAREVYQKYAVID